MRILMSSSEMAPLAKTGGLGDVLGALPLALAKLGHEVTVVIPFYKHINAAKYGIEVHGDWFDVWVGNEHIFGGLHKWIPQKGVTVYLVAQDSFFGRDGIYGDSNGSFGDNHKRFIFLSLATLVVARRMIQSNIAPDIFHGHDWHAGLIPFYLSEGRLGFNIPTVFTIHNLQYQGRFAPSVLFDANISSAYYHPKYLELYGSISFMKAGLVFSDIISAVSPGYAREIQTPDFGEGLDALLRARDFDLEGIVNGIDTDLWNPATDQYIPAHFSPGNMIGKSVCKKYIQQLFKLPVNQDIPLFAIVSRLVEQKGMSLVEEILPRLLSLPIQLVVLGSGEGRFEYMLQKYAKRYNQQMAVYIGFSEELAHQIEAGADLFLMPSRFEPCGLNQLYSLRYGTVPIVRAVGGLDDTVKDFDPKTGIGNGFKFKNYDVYGILWAINRSLSVYDNVETWNYLREKIMFEEHSWESAATNYLELYERAIWKSRRKR